MIRKQQQRSMVNLIRSRSGYLRRYFTFLTQNKDQSESLRTRWLKLCLIPDPWRILESLPVICLQLSRISCRLAILDPDAYGIRLERENIKFYHRHSADYKFFTSAVFNMRVLHEIFRYSPW